MRKEEMDFSNDAFFEADFHISPSEDLQIVLDAPAIDWRRFLPSRDED